jgi:Xaa-Pro aminopeptidase
MEDAGLDLLLVHTRHNLRYLTGGYYFHFYNHFTRIGRSQYLPLLGLPRESLDAAFYIAHSEERGQMELHGLWVANRSTASRTTVSAVEAAIQSIRHLGLTQGTIGVELPFFPADAFLAIRQALPQATFIDATILLDELRARKSPTELAHLRTVYDRTAEGIQAAFAASRPGITTAAVADRVRREMAERGLTFLWSFTCAGPGTLRAPSRERWEPGRVLHIDAGGEDRGYLADICRMGCMGEPPPLARELHAACLDVQGRVRRLVRAGLPCKDVLLEGERIIRKHRLAAYGRFVAHGIGMVSHEQPEISPTNSRPLKAGMVLSIETDFVHPEVGHVKIEDAVAVTDTGCEGLGDLGREWHVVGL